MPNFAAETGGLHLAKVPPLVLARLIIREANRRAMRL